MADRRPLLISLYRGLARALTPIFNVLFWSRSRKGKEIASRKGERFGHAGMARPSGHLVWIHAASVGETMSILPVIDALARNGNSVLLTTVTVTSAELAESRLPEGAIHQFVPYDAPGSLGRFLDHWKPDLAMVVESEIWPCLFDEIHDRKIPFVLLNGRLSDGSHRNWARLASVSKYLFNCLDLVLAQSEADAARFRRLGCRNVETPGNLKFDAERPGADATALSALRAQIGERPVWLAALTHPGEEEIALQAHEALKTEFPKLMLVLVPRHPARADEISTLIEERELKVASRTAGDDILAATDVYLGDTLGEMGLYYGLAPVTFLGGSFSDVGGHNPVEAALSGSALVTGPKVANARAVYKDFFSSGAAIKVEDPGNLAKAIAGLLGSPAQIADQSAKARALVEGSRGALEKTLRLLQPYLTVEDRDRMPEAPNEQGS
ncbi:3-deoxy-D-manno-octulosonic acid transferase [Roseibium sp. SCPC15]|uniref:3-deoxy-D-manno-octulosonic acid transferase n=1 Tax=Roseibium sp. SCP15 TaxID=3141376 RepID=UPI00333BE816